MLKKRVLVLSATPWSMKDEQTQQDISGVSIHYIIDSKENDGKLKGTKPAKATISLEKFNAIPQLPAFLDADFDLKNSQGKMVLDLKNIDGKHVPLAFA